MPERKRRRRREPMPKVLKDRAGAAARHHAKRYPAPDIDIVPSGAESWSIASPYRSVDEEDWWRLVGEAFGTRTKRVVAVFMQQLSQLVGGYWDRETNRALPEEAEMAAALSIVAAMKPRNEAEAAQAAQAVAVHLAAMKVGANVSCREHVDPRQVNALANLVKAYSGVMESMRKGRSKGSSRQTIVVKKDVRIFNDNRSVTVRPGGASAADQRDTAEGNTRARPGNDDTPCNGAGAGQLIEVAALPSPPEVREALQGARGEGAEGVPDARGPKSRST